MSTEYPFDTLVQRRFRTLHLLHLRDETDEIDEI